MAKKPDFVPCRDAATSRVDLKRYYVISQPDYFGQGCAVRGLNQSELPVFDPVGRNRDDVSRN